jgi:hypothetical protein
MARVLVFLSTTFLGTRRLWLGPNPDSFGAHEDGLKIAENIRAYGVAGYHARLASL